MIRHLYIVSVFLTFVIWLLPILVEVHRLCGCGSRVRGGRAGARLLHGSWHPSSLTEDRAHISRAAGGTLNSRTATKVRVFFLIFKSAVLLNNWRTVCYRFFRKYTLSLQKYSFYVWLAMVVYHKWLLNFIKEMFTSFSRTVNFFLIVLHGGELHDKFLILNETYVSNILVIYFLHIASFGTLASYMWIFAELSISMFL